MVAALVVLDLLGLYLAIGLLVALAFVSVGIARVLPQGTPVTIGARLLIIPGAMALWPYVVSRWRRAVAVP